MSIKKSTYVYSGLNFENEDYFPIFRESDKGHRFVLNKGFAVPPTKKKI